MTFRFLLVLDLLGVSATFEPLRFRDIGMLEGMEISCDSVMGSSSRSSRPMLARVRARLLFFFPRFVAFLSSMTPADGFEEALGS